MPVRVARPPHRTFARVFAVLAGVALTIAIGSLETTDRANGLSSAISNPSFETPSTGGYLYAPSGAGWTFANYAGVQHNGSAYSGGTVAPDGSQTAFLQGFKGSLGSMSQVVTTPPGTYSVRFQIAERAGTAQPVSVSVDGKAIGTYSPSSTAFTSISTNAFSVTAGSHMLSFSATDGSGDKTSLIDAVGLSTVTGSTPPAPSPTATAPSAPPVTNDIDLTGYRQTFGDEFDSLSVSASSPKRGSTWYAYPPYGAAGNYSASTWTPDALSTDSGVLRARAYQSGGRWYSGNISSVDTTGAGFSQLFGYYEARVKMPDSGTGSWPAFWMTSTSGIPGVSPTPVQSEEVDIFEFYGGTNQPGNPQPFVQQASHNYRPGASQNPPGSSYLYQPQTRMPGGAYPWQGFHTYGVKIDAVHVTWYIDGVQTNQISTPTSYLTGPFYLMLDYGLGGGYPLSGVVDGSAMQVDWVRAYALPGQ